MGHVPIRVMARGVADQQRSFGGRQPVASSGGLAHLFYERRRDKERRWPGAPRQTAPSQCLRGSAARSREGSEWRP